MQSVYNRLSKKNELKKQYGIKNIHEMLAELSNPEFRALVEEGGFWKVLLNAIKRMLGFEGTYNAELKELDNILSSFLENYNEEAYMDAVESIYQREIFPTTIEEVDAKEADAYSDVMYSIREKDAKTLDMLNNGETIKVYRAMQVIDGKLYPPMSAKVDGKMREPIELGVWERAEERPDLADAKGYFKLDKGNKSSLKARYNPYIHTSLTPLNDQFSSAQDRPNLVTVEVEIPASELTSGYKAEKAKDAVGKLEWKAGVVQSQLSGTRTVILSRWDRPLRIVPDSEVAQRIVEMFGDKEVVMPSNVVTPSLRAELEKLGVPFKETDNQGKEVKYSIRLPKEEYATLSSIIMTRQHTYKRPSFDYAFTGRGFYVYNYLGDGISNINFAIPIAGNKDLIDIIYKAIDNGTVNSTRSLDTLLEEIQSGKGGYPRNIINAVKKRRRDKSIYIYSSRGQINNSRRVFASGKRRSGSTTSRGTSRNADEFGDEVVKYSLKSLDAPYLDAVARGDMATAERLVREAAAIAMPNTKVVDEDGLPKIVEHSTWNDDFYTFDINHLGESSGDEGVYGAGFYFGNVGETELYGDRAIQVYLNLHNPLVLPDAPIKGFFDYLVENFDKEGLRDIVVKQGNNTATMGDVVDAIKSVNEAHAQGEYAELIEQMSQYWMGAEGRVLEQQIFRKIGFAIYPTLEPFIQYNVGRKEFSEALRNAGYDGVVYNNQEYVAFNPNQIKSADVVTYDDAGNIIPLSERFNPEKEDIRYSLREATGEKLTPAMIRHHMMENVTRRQEWAKYVVKVNNLLIVFNGNFAYHILIE